MIGIISNWTEFREKIKKTFKEEHFPSLVQSLFKIDVGNRNSKGSLNVISSKFI